MYNLKLTDMRAWCEEQLDIANIPKGSFRDAVMKDMFSEDCDTPYKLWKYIQDNIYAGVSLGNDDELEEEEEEKAGGL